MILSTQQKTNIGLKRQSSRFVYSKSCATLIDQKNSDSDSELFISNSCLRPSFKISKKTISNDNLRKYVNELILSDFSQRYLKQIIEMKDLDKALTDLRQIFGLELTKSSYSIFKLIAYVLVNDGFASRELGIFLYNLINQNFVDIDIIESGLQKSFIFIHRLFVENSKNFFMSEIIAFLFNRKPISIEFLKNSFKPILDSILCANLICKALWIASVYFDKDKTVDIFLLSNLNIDYFLTSVKDHSNLFLNEHKIGWFSEHKYIRERALMNRYQLKLQTIKVDWAIYNHKLFEKNFRPIELNSRIVPRCLIWTVIYSCLVGNVFKKISFRFKSQILYEFLDLKSHLKYEPLFALVEFETLFKENPNLLKTIFWFMLTEDIIHIRVYEDFLKWSNLNNINTNLVTIEKIKEFLQLKEKFLF